MNAAASGQCPDPGGKPALVLLDVGLPDQDGFEVCRQIRPHYDGIICVLTARTDNIDQVLGLELGADDYIGKPIEPRVLLARLPTCAATAGSSHVTAACASAS